MALTETETFGTVVPGFVTDLDGNLAVTTDDTGAGYGIVPGFITDPDGRLLVTETTTDAEFDGGFVRSPAGALVVSTGTPVTGVVPGFTTTEEGYLLCGAADSPTWDGGLLRNSDGALAVTGLSGGGNWAGTYTESFDTDDGGWSITPSDAPNVAERHTAIFQSTPACLRGSYSDLLPAILFKALPGDPGSYALTCYVRCSAASTSVDVAVVGADGDFNSVDTITTTAADPENNWQAINLSGALAGAAITQILITVTATGPAYDVTDYAYVDTVQLEKTA